MLLVTKALLYSCTSSSLCAAAAMSGKDKVTSPSPVDNTPSATTALVLPTSRDSGAGQVLASAAAMQLQELLRHGIEDDARRRQKQGEMEAIPQVQLRHEKKSVARAAVHQNELNFTAWSCLLTGHADCDHGRSVAT